MAYEIYKIDKNENQKCEMPNCSKLADYQVDLQRNNIESKIFICENCCGNLFCYEEKEKNIYNPRKEI